MPVPGWMNGIISLDLYFNPPAMKFNLSFYIFCLLLITLSSCRGTRPAVAKKLPVISDLNELPEKKKAVYHSASGNKYILSYQSKADEENEDRMPVGDSIASRTAAAAHENKNCDAHGCPDHCEFDGKKRSDAKTSISNGALKTYRTVKHFLEDFADKHPDKDMKAVVGNSNGRVQLEDFNAVIKKAWLFCYAKESDEDFHLVIGNTRNKNAAGNRFIIVEIGGLPKSGTAINTLSKVQQDFFALIGGSVCSGGYIWFDEGNAPRKISVKGSIYWDTEHWSQAKNKPNHHGPDELEDRLTTVWEIHPITEIKEQ